MLLSIKEILCIYIYQYISTIQGLYLDFKKQALLREECTCVWYHQKDKQNPNHICTLTMLSIYRA